MTVVAGHKGVGKSMMSLPMGIGKSGKVLIMDDMDNSIPAGRWQGGEYDNEVPIDEVPIEKSVLKSVYCNYRGFLIVYDVHGKKVHELSGEITLEKYEEIEKRTQDGITEFEGLDDYRCIACELKKKAHDAAWDNNHDPFGKPIAGSGTFGSFAGALGNPYASPVSGNTLPTGIGQTATPTQPKIQPTIQQQSSPPPNPNVGEIYQDVNTKTYFVFTGGTTGWIELVPASLSGVVPASMAQRKPQTQPQTPPKTQDDDLDPFTRVINNIARRKPML